LRFGPHSLAARKAFPSLSFPGESPMNSNPVGWFEIYVQDMRRAQAFYEQVFGLKLEKFDNPEPEMLIFPGQMDRYGAQGALVRMPGMNAGGNSVLVYFGCADCAQEAERAQACGGRVHKPKSAIGQHGYIALIIDTEGNMLGLHSMQ
jgi:predicted enzyme related to lactoylglutathione lyase